MHACQKSGNCLEIIGVSRPGSPLEGSSPLWESPEGGLFIDGDAVIQWIAARRTEGDGCANNVTPPPLCRTTLFTMIFYMLLSWCLNVIRLPFILNFLVMNVIQNCSIWDSYFVNFRGKFSNEVTFRILFLRVCSSEALQNYHLCKLFALLYYRMMLWNQCELDFLGNEGTQI